MYKLCCDNNSSSICLVLVNRSFVNLTSDSEYDFENYPSIQKILFTSSSMKVKTDRYTIDNTQLHAHAKELVHL